MLETIGWKLRKYSEDVVEKNAEKSGLSSGRLTAHLPPPCDSVRESGMCDRIMCINQAD